MIYYRNKPGEISVTVTDTNTGEVYYSASGTVTTTGEKSIEWSYRDETVEGKTQAEIWASDGWIVPAGTEVRIDLTLTADDENYSISKTYTVSEEDVRNADHLSLTTEDHLPLVGDVTITSTNNTLAITTINDSFDSNIAKADVTVNGLPNGLDYSVTWDNSKQITITFSGTTTEVSESASVTIAGGVFSWPYGAPARDLTTETFRIDW